MIEFLTTHPSLFIIAATVLILIILFIFNYNDKSNERRKELDLEAANFDMPQLRKFDQDEPDNMQPSTSSSSHYELLERNQSKPIAVPVHKIVYRHKKPSQPQTERASVSKLPNQGNYVNFSEHELLSDYDLFDD